MDRVLGAVHGRVFSRYCKACKAQEFLELKQGAMTMMGYVTRFTDLAPID